MACRFKNTKAWSKEEDEYLLLEVIPQQLKVEEVDKRAMTAAEVKEAFDVAKSGAHITEQTSLVDFYFYMPCPSVALHSECALLV